MGKEIFRVTLNYKAAFTTVVEANDEGEALDKARNIAENDADLKQFHLGIEDTSTCEHIGTRGE